MKNIVKNFIMLFLVIPFLFTSCDDPDLPYPLDEVERGVLVDIARTPGTEAFIDAVSPTLPNPDLGVTISVVPKGDGEWESLDVVVIYRNVVAQTFQKAVVASNITSLPQEISIDYPALLNTLGIERENPGDAFTVVTDIRLPSGTVLWGWTPEAGFTNSDFASWQFEGRGYSRRVVYPAACPITPEVWEGPADVHRINAAGTWENDYENSFIVALDPEDVPPVSFFEDLGLDADEIEALDLVGLHLFGIFLEEDYPPSLWRGDLSNLKVWIDNNTFSVFIPDHPMGVEVNLGALLGAADDWHEIIFADGYDFELDSCNGILIFTGALDIGTSGFWFSWNTFTVQPGLFGGNGDDEPLEKDDDNEDDMDLDFSSHFSIR